MTITNVKRLLNGLILFYKKGLTTSQACRFHWILILSSLDSNGVGGSSLSSLAWLTQTSIARTTRK